MKVEVAVLGSLSLIVFMVAVDVAVIIAVVHLPSQQPEHG